MSRKQQLIERVSDRTAVIGVVGLGYVGLPLSLCFAEAGFKVIGFDIDPEKTSQINRGQSYIRHFSDAVIKKAVDSSLSATSDFVRAGECDALLLCVPTPLDDQRIPDLSFIADTMDSLLPHLKAGQLVSLGSTTYPGTTEEELRPRIESRGFTIGVDIFLVYSPEREDPGNLRFTTRTTPKVVSGSTPACLEVGQVLFGTVIDRVVPVSSTHTAEMVKLLENIHRAVNIGLVNELKIVCDRMGINIYEVIDAAATKPFGFVPYFPGPGLGGHCLPIDPFYLAWKAQQFGVDTQFIKLAGEVNRKMPSYVVEKVEQALALRNKSLADSSVLVLGIAYKKNVDDMRESPSAEIMQQLQDLGSEIAYCDPLVPVFPKMREYHFELKSVPYDARTLAGFDCVVIVTNHDIFDYELLALHAQTIVDTRGVFRGRNHKVFPA